MGTLTDPKNHGAHTAAMSTLSVDQNRLFLGCYGTFLKDPRASDQHERAGTANVRHADQHYRQRIFHSPQQSHTRLGVPPQTTDVARAERMPRPPNGSPRRFGDAQSVR
jgi:hypothetical protein